MCGFLYLRRKRLLESRYLGCGNHDDLGSQSVLLERIRISRRLLVTNLR